MLLARLALLTPEGTAEVGTASQHFTVVRDWNAYEVPPSRRPPAPAGPIKNISTLEGCQQYCASTPGCLQFAWNERTPHGPVRYPPQWYCEISSARVWSGVPSNHIISGCLPGVVKGCGERPPAPAPAPPAPAPTPTPWTPVWTATQPSATNGTYGYPLLAADKAVHTYVCESLRSLSMHFLC